MTALTTVTLFPQVYPNFPVAARTGAGGTATLTQSFFGRSPWLHGQLGPYPHTVLSLIPSFSLPDVLCDPTDLIWRKGTPFEAMTGRTAPSSDVS